ncbi:MAG: HAMP domain-containing sensor histidine kinase, partial [Cyanobacteria bacterium P01_C01_bin.147]
SSSMRILARGDKTHKVEAQLHETLDSAILLLQHRLKANEQRPAIQMRKHYSDLPPILCYPGQLNQVFMNILANAVDAFEESNKGISYEELEESPNVIDVTTQHENNSITIYLQDNGPGMPDAVKAKVFEHLFTTKAVGKGTGLGLSISHQIVVDTHGGSLSCDSNPGKGTTFTITLPLQ